jgi:hypothetical protein
MTVPPDGVGFTIRPWGAIYRRGDGLGCRHGDLVGSKPMFDLIGTWRSGLKARQQATREGSQNDAREVLVAEKASQPFFDVNGNDLFRFENRCGQQLAPMTSNKIQILVSRNRHGKEADDVGIISQPPTGYHLARCGSSLLSFFAPAHAAPHCRRSRNWFDGVGQLQPIWSVLHHILGPT